ncbi:fluoride efflux transporter CrcB [Kineococcus endophyticus]|uniref:Fluoride-specific ion channel FluC n=1 Tax=Kineococcus endophyticus TaxID=1181883 RepID=A0ABV3PCW3_9ACTN
MSAVVVLVTCLAGSAGAVTRFVVDGEIRRRWAGSFPWATLVINVSGSLVLGLVTGAVLGHGAPSVWKTVLGTGFCGGYTTFSTATVETLRLAQARAGLAAVAYSVATFLGSAVAAAVGLVLGWQL